MGHLPTWRVHLSVSCSSFRGCVGFSRQEYWILPFPSPVDHILSEFSAMTMGFTGGWDSKASACDEGDPGLIPGSGRTLKKEMATQYSNFAWKIPWMEEPGGLYCMGLQRVRHDWVTSLHFQPWPVHLGWPYMAWLLVHWVRQGCGPCDQFG